VKENEANNSIEQEEMTKTEIQLDGDSFLEIGFMLTLVLKLKAKLCEITTNKERFNNEEETKVSNEAIIASGSEAKTKKTGRPALHVLHPEILLYIQEFISANATESASERRRNDQSYVGGFSSKQLLAYVIEQSKKNQSKILQISEKTIQRYFIPPNKGHKNAEMYKSLFNVKVVGGKINLIPTFF